MSNYNIKSLRKRALYLFDIGLNTGQVAYALGIQLDLALMILEEMEGETLQDSIRRKERTEEGIYQRCKTECKTQRQV